MASNAGGRLVILTGPSCVGKSPLARAMAKYFPELRAKLRHVVLYNDREPRPGERDGVDYHFRPRKMIESMREKEQFLVLDVRGDLQALDVTELREILAEGDAFFEGNPFIGRRLLEHDRLREVPKLGMFMSPLSRGEIKDLRSKVGDELPSTITDIMRRKLLRRTRKQKGELSLPDLQNIEKRAGSAYRELTMAFAFEHIIVNHDGEDSEHWDAFAYPVGDARRSLHTVVALLRGKAIDRTQRWSADLLPQAL